MFLLARTLSYKQPGFNSLLLLRWVNQKCIDCENAIETMADAQRGVSWCYLIADGNTDKSCVVEAGKKTEKKEFLDNVDARVFDALEDSDSNIRELLDTPSTDIKEGLMVRWTDYSSPTAKVYQDYNEQLINYHRNNNRSCDPAYDYEYVSDDFSPDGYLNKHWEERKCPGRYYFPPQRESFNSFVLVTNHFVIPEMNLFSMNEVINILSRKSINDSQWRYDELNNQILNILKDDDGNKKMMTYDDAKKTINFLTPDPEEGQFDYYPKVKGDEKKIPDLNEIQVEGAISILDLKEKTIESLYGYYSDEWVKISLKNYLK